MFCANCGTKNEDGAVFCAGCGQKLEAPVAMAPASEVTPAPAPAPVEFNGLEDEATVAAYFNPATGMTTPVAPAPQPVAPAPEVVAQPAAPAPAPEMVAQSVAPAPAPEMVAQPVAPAPAPEMAAQPVAPAPQPVAPAPAPAPAATEPKEKKPVNKAIFIIIGAVAAVLIIGIIIFAAVKMGGGSSSKYSASWHFWYSTEDEVTNIVYGDTLFKETIDGDAYTVSYSMDNSVVVVRNEEYEYFVLNTKGKITSLGESLSSVNVAQNGSVIAYVDEDEDLYSYTVSNGKAKKIAEDVYSVVVSPSGKSFAYVVDDDDDRVMYVFDGKNETELSKNATPIGLTDDCKYIYYYDYNKDALYVTNLKDNSNKIASDCDDFIFNKDHTEVMFTTDSGLYASVKGGDKQKVSGKDYMARYIGIFTDECYHYDSVSGAYTYNLSSLKNQYYVCGDSIIKVDKKWSSESVIKNIDDLSISDDHKTVYYTNDNGTLYSCKLDGKYEANKIKSDVTYFDITRDGNSVYFIVDNDSLYYQKGKSDSTKIATDVYSVRVSYDGIAFFLLDYDYDDSTGTLYYSKGGKDKQKVASDVYSYTCYRDTTIYTDNYEYESDYDDETWTYYSCTSYDVYMASSGTKFKKLLESVGYKYSY